MISLQHFFHRPTLDKASGWEKGIAVMIAAKIPREERVNTMTRLEVLVAGASRRKNPYKQTRKEIAASLKRLKRAAQIGK